MVTKFVLVSVTVNPNKNLYLDICTFVSGTLYDFVSGLVDVVLVCMIVLPPYITLATVRFLPQTK